MGKQKGQFFTGRIGNVIYYELNGGYYMRAAPSKVRQTKATKISSSNFSVAAGAGRVLRNLLQAAIPFPKNKKMQNLFAGAIMKWLQLQSPEQLAPAMKLPYIQDFQFNESNSLHERWKVSLTLKKETGDLLQLQIPAFIPTDKIAAPALTNEIECTVAAASCTLKNSIANGKCVHSFSIPFNDIEIPAQTINLPVAMPPGSLVVTAVSLSCFVSKKGKQAPSNNIAFMPSGIVAAMFV